MHHLSIELDRIHVELLGSPTLEQRGKLYAAQQALAWALDPGAFRKPYETAMGTLEGLKGCSAPLHQPLS